MTTTGMTTSSQTELPLLQVSLLEKHYGSQALLKIEQLSLNAGQAVLLSGRNGAGKSTLLKILAGLEPCQLASFRYRNQLLSKRQRSNLGGKIIYLHQHPYLFDASVAANIGYGLTRLSRSERDARIAQALDWSGLSHLALRNAKTLSGGEQQRVALARAWVMEPELLLMDEPTANMDSESRQQTQFLIRRLINEGRTVVLSSHDLKSEQRLFQRHWRLRNGQIDEQPLTSPGIIDYQSSSYAAELKQITEV